MDAKKSPLALLAQTCSQIGADSPSSKPLISSLDKSNRKSSDLSNLSVRSSPANQPQQLPHSQQYQQPQPKSKNSKNANSNGSDSKFGFKPYESSLGSNSSCKKDDSSRPNSKTSASASEDKSDCKSEHSNVSSLKLLILFG